MYINHTPYKTQTEHQTFVHWQSRTESCMVISRSFGNFNILGDTMPKAAWSYDCLKHGLLSAASVTASIEKFSLGEFNERQAVVEAVKQSSLAISSIFDEKPPPEVTVLVAFVFWFMEAWLGSWSRAVMHLASAARICEQGYPKGEVSEGVACHDGFDENFYIRLLWGFREAVAGISLLQGARLKARQVRPNESGQFDTILATHQAQMEFLSGRWLRHAQSQPASVQREQDMPPPPAIPMYSTVMDMVNHFLNNDDRYDPLVLAIHLKMVQRSLPLFVAGKNMEIRRDAALSIPIKARPLELEPQRPPIQPQSTTAVVR
ncbi:hypothetical protein LTR70_010729 [Exophiala xenobiotica]|uniref:Uncharacterized protein n=1 Tax=Lithohypha guttulata TaxID=1690604 RepID=A0ABR0JSZ2_9EURO|nr:hypothetical protein LTR24_010731 [Lithohypha guttulata]KAK5308927.1 hypothetical protein LTR70_010729 [Exophiala xenobiotica]